MTGSEMNACIGRTSLLNTTALSAGATVQDIVNLFYKKTL